MKQVLLWALVASCTLGGRDAEDTDDIETAPVRMFVVDRANQCVRYAAVPMPAAWREGWPQGHDCVDSLDPFMGEVWSGHCVFMPNLCFSAQMVEAEISRGGGSGLHKGCSVTDTEPCDCVTSPWGLPFCGTDTLLRGDDCWNRDWPESDCGLTPEPI